MRCTCQSHDQIDAVSGEDQIFRVIMGKADNILIICGQECFKIINDILAKVFSDYIDVMARLALHDLVASIQIKDISVLVAYDFAATDKEQFFRHTKCDCRRFHING